MWERYHNLNNRQIIDSETIFIMRRRDRYSITIIYELLQTEAKENKKLVEK